MKTEDLEDDTFCYARELIYNLNAKCYIMGEQRASQLNLSRRASGLVSMPSAPSHYIDLQNRAAPAAR